MKVYVNSMNKKQLQRALEAKELSMQGTKADLELSLKEHLELEGMDITEFYLEEEEAEETGAKEQVSMNDFMAFMKEQNRQMKEQTEHNKQIIEQITKMDERMTEQTEQNRQVKEQMAEMKEQLSKQMSERSKLFTEQATNVSDKIKQIVKKPMEPITKSLDQADNCEEEQEETSDELIKNIELKEIQISDVSVLHKNLTEVIEETECNNDNKQSELLDKSFELGEEIAVQCREDADKESEEADEGSEDAAQGSIFVSVKVTVDSECAEGNGVIRNTNISKGAVDEEEVCSEFGDCIMKVAVETDKNEKIRADLLPASLDAEISDSDEESDTPAKTHVYHATPDVGKSDGEQLEDVNYYDDDLEDSCEEGDIPGKTQMDHVIPVVQKLDDEQRDIIINKDRNYYDNNEGIIPGKTPMDCATRDECYHQHQPMRYQIQIVLMNQTLKLAEWEDDEEQKELNPDQFVLRKKETTRVSNRLEIYYTSLASKWLTHVEMKKMLLIGLYKWESALIIKMHSVEYVVLLPSPCWSKERAETAGSIPDTGWGLDRCGLLPCHGDLLLQTILRWTMDLLAMNCFDEKYLYCDCR